MRKPLFVVLFLLIALSGFAQVIDKPAATVNLTKREVITQKQLKQQVTTLEKGMKSTLTTEKRKEVLDAMINAMLVLQAADKDGIKVSDAEVNAFIAQQYRTPLETSLGKKMADADFKKVITDQSGISWDEFMKQVKENAIQQRYIAEKKKSDLQAIAAPTDKEVQDAYDADSMQYVNPDIVKFSQVFIDTRSMNADAKDKARKELETAYQDIKNGKVSFNDLLVKYSEIPKANYQVDFTAFLARNDVQKMTLLGASFYQTMFAMDKGETKGIVESKIGYHIVRLVEKIPKKFLSLDDKVLPDKDITVRQYIRQQLYVEKQQTALQQAIADVVKDLRKKAEIKVYDENLNW